MIKRYDYKLRDYGLSGHNEPPQDRFIEVNVRNYPDMYQVYQRFSNIFGVKMNQFILGNGAENIIKNVLLAIKPKSLSWNYPTWNMLEVYCEALNIKPDNREFKLSDLSIISGFTEKDKVDCYYTNLGKTSLFEYFNFPNPQANTYICDCTYTPLNIVHNILPEILQNNRNILVGSLGKLYGAGLRLGFAIFNEDWNDRMQIQREQYLNQAACEFILNSLDFGKQPDIPYYKELKEFFPMDFCSLTSNYITLIGHIEANKGLNPFYFKVQGQEFTRFGLPNNDTEFKALRNILLNYQRKVNHEYD